MATRKKRKKTPAEPSTRWAGLTPEERSQKMSELSQRSKLSPEDRAAIAWLRENHDLMAEIIANFAAYKAQGAELAERAEPEPRMLAPVTVESIAPAAPAIVLPPPLPITAFDKMSEATLAALDHARVEEMRGLVVELPERAAAEPPPVEGSAFVRIARGGFVCTGCGSRFTVCPTSCGTCTPAADRVQIDSCSVCLGPIYDLDSPCENCVQAGRLTPAANPAQLHAAQTRAASPWTQAPTVHDVPRVSNHAARPALPNPAPPLRAYTAQETCQSCGRIPELHQDHGGPLGHNHQPQPPPPVAKQ